MKNFILIFVIFISTISISSIDYSFDWKHSPDPRTKGYVIVWGTNFQTSNRVYSSFEDVGYTTNATIQNMDTNISYYFNIYAYGGNSNNLMSDYDGEVIIFRAPKPPENIRVVTNNIEK